MKKTKHALFRVLVPIGAAVSLLLAANVGFAASSCVTCHTDEDMLIENLAKAKGKKSAMQSGAG